MLGVEGLMINHRRPKGLSVSEEFEKLTSTMGVLSMSMQTFFFLHLIINFPFISRDIVVYEDRVCVQQFDSAGSKA